MKSREFERQTLNVTGSFRTQHGMQWNIALVDFSRGGCQISDVHGRLLVGDWGKIYVVGTGPHHAQVVWRQGRRVGLAFRDPLPERVVQHLARGEWGSAAAAYNLSRGSGSMRRFV